jgi:DNA-binding MurR/RpiR family transcriptional regulator
MNARIFTGSFSPFVSTPDATSTAYGSAARSASVTFSGVSPPERITGPAARAARAAGVEVIALVGRPGGEVRRLADLAVVVPSDDYGIVEDVHLAINHIVKAHLRDALGASAAPRPVRRPRRRR